MTVDGVHDVGGMHGFGPVMVEPDEPIFHADWERRVFGLAMAIMQGAGSSLSPGRAVIERIDPVTYLSSSYYESWMTAMASIMVGAGVVTSEELRERATGDFPLSGLAPEDPVDPELPVEEQLVPRFRVGERVRVRDLHAAGHTRCPRYVRRRIGTVVRVDDPMPVPDVEAATGEQVMQPVYCVRFSGEELWGHGGAVVHVDLWDGYLEPA